MCEHIRAAFLHDGSDVVAMPSKVADQRFDAKLGAVMLDATNRLRDVSGTAIGQVVAVDHGQHHIREPHLGER